MTENFIEKLYAGFLGMNIGIRLGAPVEPVAWDFERIASVYGEISGYLKNYRNFAADDDVNGPVYFLRGLTDKGIHEELEPQDIGRAWLNYARSNIGMFWWGGEGVSTEHTAYMNLKRGIPAPASGSIAQNGQELAEQIGGQIFIDTWGFIWPGNPEKASQYAVRAASVSHDGAGLHGAAFMAACIAQAFVDNDIADIIRAGLRQIPHDSVYAQVINAVARFHSENPHDFRSCMRYLADEWGYDKYGGVCHIIPNAGVCALSMLYGGGDFSRTIEIASMCGWDTDCNAGNVGSILGVMNGLAGIRRDYREPVNDIIITSGISGYLNIMDVPTYVKDLAYIACGLRGEELPEYIERPQDGNLLFDFELPGSTHGIRLSNEIRFMKRHSTERAFSGSGSLEIIIDRILPEDSCDVYYKPFYRRADFNDERYKPVFSPTVYSGQRVSFRLYLEIWLDGVIEVRPYIKTAMRGETAELSPCTLERGCWNEICFTVPETCGDQIAELGFTVTTPQGAASRVFGRLFLDDFRVEGDFSYSIDMAVQEKEFAQLTPFSLNQCMADKSGVFMRVESQTECQAFTGNYYMKDCTVEVTMIPLDGEGKGVILRGKGAEYYYQLGFGREGYAAITRHSCGTAVLKELPYRWERGKEYILKGVCEGGRLALYINGGKVIEAYDDTLDYGMAGVGQEGRGRLLCRDMKVSAKKQGGFARIK